MSGRGAANPAAALGAATGATGAAPGVSGRGAANPEARPLTPGGAPGITGFCDVSGTDDTFKSFRVTGWTNRVPADFLCKPGIFCRVSKASKKLPPVSA